MSPFLSYILRAGLYLGLFYAFYLLVMRRTTFFRLNRVILLAGSYLCLLLPLIRLRTVSSVSQAESPTMVAVGQDVETLTSSVMIPWQLLLGVYLAGVLITLALFGRSALKTGRLIRRGKETEREGCRLVLLEDEIPSFSWGRRVVMNRDDLAENPAIFTHERMHVQCRHTLDLLLILPIQLLFWWNPLVWITREELRLLHEYQADEGVIQNGIDATQYQLLLVRKAVGEDRFTLASGFLHAKLKNRITMMLKPTSSSWMRWSYLALIPVLAAFMFACNPSRKAQEPEPAASEADVITLENDALSFEDVEIKPTFNGIDADEFARWVNSQLKYPEQAKQDGITGRVTLQFTIETDGSVTDVKVLQGVREDLDSESVRVVSASPKWEPGKHNGKPVKVTYRLPIVYQLR